MGGSCVPPLDGLRWMAVRGSEAVVSAGGGGSVARTEHRRAGPATGSCYGYGGQRGTGGPW